MISLCMIAIDEALLLEQCLSSVKDLVSEIIVVVDDRSSDATVAIAQKFGAKVVMRKWNDDFSAARNASLALATQPWILVLDGDEVLDVQDHDRIRALVKRDDHVGYSFVQKTYTNDNSLANFMSGGDDLLHKSFKGFMLCNIVRLFKNDASFRFVGPVHEYIEDSLFAKGLIGVTSILIHHYQELKGVSFFREKQLKYLELYEKNIAAYPNQARAYRHMGNLYYTFVHDFVKAKECFEKSLLLKKNPDTFVGLAWCYMQLKDFVKAEEVLKEGLAVKRDHPLLWISRGKLYILTGKPRAARTCFENVLKLGHNPVVQDMLDHLNRVLG
ncbi:MAG TPA: glycosyltransferase [Candidatus Nanoarchaeia archaeon]|nr:glycosyltransferase [Candidatus Nanoarchaeia archaeon]